MRLFIAINFNNKIKDSLCDTIQRLKKHAVQGNFTRCENLHLTLAFIGETTRVHTVKQTIDQVSAQTFELSFSGLGKFRRDGGDIYWIGVEKNIELSTINKQLCSGLLISGFPIENREFKPHLTLGRKVILDNSFDKNEFLKTILQMSMTVVKISLMKSERINGELTYTEIFYKDLVEK